MGKEKHLKEPIYSKSKEVKDPLSHLK